MTDLVLELKDTRYYFRKLVRLVTAIFIPWKILWEHRSTLKKYRNTNQSLSEENASLSLKINSLISANTRLMFQQETSWKISLDEVAGLLNWPNILIDSERMNGFSELFRLFSLFSHNKNTVDSPSNCWILLFTKNCDQLLEYGYNNFKRTVGLNYFNFLVQKGDPQIDAAEKVLSKEIVESCRKTALTIPDDPNINNSEQFSYKYFVLLLWEYAKLIDSHRYLDKLEEPREGSPILISTNGKSMSQDLANSVIEYYSIDNAVSFKNIHSVLEIGAGYGRNAFVTLSLNPKIKIYLVDILPALYIAQRYLCSIFKDKKIFKASNFNSYDEVKTEIESASIIFLMPHQLELIPDNTFDLSMNISSFGEMSTAQIDWYFSQINRTTDKYFYLKQWNVSKNPFDNLELKKTDYPYPQNWQAIYSRNCAIQSDFFETLFEVKHP